MLTIILLIVTIINMGILLYIKWLLRHIANEINHWEMWTSVPPETFFK